MKVVVARVRYNSLINFYISYMIFIYYLFVFPLVKRFIHEPLARETG